MLVIPKREKYHGAMVGTLCGDALGAPYEWSWHPRAIEEDMNTRGGLVPHEYVPFDYIEPWKKKKTIQQGQPTDDSELAAALAQSFVERKNFDETDLYARLRSFIHGRKSILSEVAYGVGSTLSAALKFETYEESVENFRANKIPLPPSNGSLMRCIAVPLRYVHNKRLASEIAKRQSCITHRNPEAQAACTAYTIFVINLLYGLPPENAWIKAREYMWEHEYKGRDDEATLKIMEMNVRDKPNFVTDIESQKGYVVLSLRIAVWATITAESFADGLVKSIAIGGDTDTYGAIAGGALGAWFGIENIPPRWSNILQGKDVMMRLSHGLYGLANG